MSTQDFSQECLPGPTSNDEVRGSIIIEGEESQDSGTQRNSSSTQEEITDLYYEAKSEMLGIIEQDLQLKLAIRSVKEDFFQLLKDLYEFEHVDSDHNDLSFRPMTPESEQDSGAPGSFARTPELVRVGSGRFTRSRLTGSYRGSRSSLRSYRSQNKILANVGGNKGKNATRGQSKKIDLESSETDSGATDLSSSKNTGTCKKVHRYRPQLLYDSHCDGSSSTPGTVVGHYDDSSTMEETPKATGKNYRSLHSDGSLQDTPVNKSAGQSGDLHMSRDRYLYMNADGSRGSSVNLSRPAHPKMAPKQLQPILQPDPSNEMVSDIFSCSLELSDGSCSDTDSEKGLTESQIKQATKGNLTKSTVDYSVEATIDSEPNASMLSSPSECQSSVMSYSSASERPEDQSSFKESDGVWSSNSQSHSTASSVSVARFPVYPYDPRAGDGYSSSASNMAVPLNSPNTTSGGISDFSLTSFLPLSSSTKASQSSMFSTQSDRSNKGAKENIQYFDLTESLRRLDPKDSAQFSSRTNAGVQQGTAANKKPMHYVSLRKSPTGSVYGHHQGIPMKAQKSSSTSSKSEKRPNPSGANRYEKSKPSHSTQHYGGGRQQRLGSLYSIEGDLDPESSVLSVSMVKPMMDTRPRPPCIGKEMTPLAAGGHVSPSIKPTEGCDTVKSKVSQGHTRRHSRHSIRRALSENYDTASTSSNSSVGSILPYKGRLSKTTNPVIPEDGPNLDTGDEDLDQHGKKQEKGDSPGKKSGFLRRIQSIKRHFKPVSRRKSYGQKDTSK